MLLLFVLSPSTNDSFFFFFSSRRRHTRCGRDWSSDVCSSDLSRLGPEVRNKKVHLVPIPRSSTDARARKRAEIMKYYQVRGPFLFLPVNLIDNRSEFSAPLEVSLRKEGGDY